MVDESRPQPIDRAVALVAARQHGVISAAQLAAIPLSRNAIAKRVAAGRLHRVFTGVYAVGVPARSIEAIRTAALLVTAPSFISHRDAGEVHGVLAPVPGPVHVTVAHGRGIRRPGIVVHRTRHLHRDERHIIGLLRVTSPARTLVDIAGTSTERRLTRAFDEAMRLRCATREEILTACKRSAARPGTGLLTELARAEVIPFDRTRSRSEARFLRFCADYGLPIPLVNVPLLGYEVDFLWPRARLVVELDGEHHDTATARARDGARDVRLREAGYAVERIRPARVRTAPGAVAKEIMTSIRRRELG